MKSKTMSSGDISSPWTGFSFRHFLLGMIALMASARVAVADPNMYLPQARIDAIQVKLDAGEALWTDAYAEVLAEADAVMALPLTSVEDGGVLESVTYGGTGSPGNNLYATRFNDFEDLNFIRYDYFAAIRLSDKTRSLGLAYAFTGESQYAERAVDLIRNWSVNSATRMAPIASNGIELYITMPGYFYGADLISNYEGWDSTEKSTFYSWANSFGNSVEARGEGTQNIASWKATTLASTGALLDDQSFLDLAEADYKRLLPLQIAGTNSSKAGQLGQEVTRTTRGGLHYSLFALNAMIQGVEILNNRGIDLYDYTDPDTGANLKLALDFIVPYALNPETWGNTPETDAYVQPIPITANDSMALFELAYSYWQDPDYLAVLERWGRPIDDIRPMGNTTLTHGNTFELTAAPGLDGDFDLDADVDGADFLRWQRDGLSSTDLADWEANFGTAAPLAAASTSVPEPSAGLMMLVCCGICAMRRRRHAAS